MQPSREVDRLSDSAYSFDRTVTAASARAIAVPDDFGRSVEHLCDEFTDLWHSTPARMPEIGPPISRRKQWVTGRDAMRLIDRLEEEIDRARRCPAEWDASRDDLRRRVERFGLDRLGWAEGYSRLLVNEAFYDTTIEFFREARAFDSNFPVEDLWQALRNVWVGNSLQMLLDRPVQLRPALFAYSMLYPVTDNLLDDLSISAVRKRRFGERLGFRLTGFAMEAADEREAQAYRLVERIESDFPRERFPCVYSSLLAIHESQCRSLDQHDGRHLSEAELLRISMAKGGTSVLPDLLLIDGEAELAEVRFAFGYGIALQLLDDLQDVEADLAAGHETLFTKVARRNNVDELAARLGCFIDTLLADAAVFDRPGDHNRMELIRRNCRMLLVDSVSSHRRRFSRAFRKGLACQWPISFRAQKRLRHRAIRLSNDAGAALLQAL